MILSLGKRRLGTCVFRRFFLRVMENDSKKLNFQRYQGQIIVVSVIKICIFVAVF